MLSLDILMLVYLCESLGLYQVANYWYQVIEINDYQKLRFSNMINETVNSLHKPKVAVLG